MRGCFLVLRLVGPVCHCGHLVWEEGAGFVFLWSVACELSDLFCLPFLFLSLVYILLWLWLFQDIISTIWAGTQIFLQDCKCVQQGLRSASLRTRVGWSESLLPPKNHLDHWLPTECSAKTLIWGFAGRTCNRVGNAVLDRAASPGS